jgi:hypothetical protein
MESTTLSPNGAAGAAPEHTLADPAAERILDTILATPFAEPDPPADLPPAGEIETELPPAVNIEPEEPPAGDPFVILPPVPGTVEPAAEPPAEQPEPPAEPAAPAAQTQPEPAAPAQEATEEAVDTDKLRTTITMEYQPTEFALFHGKAMEITARHNEDAFFSGHYVTIDKTTGKIIAGNKIEMQSAAQLEPIRNATSLLRLRKGLMLRAAEVLDAMITALGQEIEKVEACMTALASSKTAIREMLPEKGKDLIF